MDEDDDYGDGHGGSPRSARENAEHYAKLGDMSEPPCKCGGKGVGLHGYHHPGGEGCRLGAVDPRLPLAIELLGEDLGPRLLAAEKVGELRVSFDELERIYALCSDGREPRLVLNPPVRLVAVREARVESVDVALEISGESPAR